jgi:hypothetical protein
MKRLLLLLSLPLSLCAVMLNTPPSISPEQTIIEEHVGPEQSPTKKKAYSKQLWRNLYDV